MKLMIAADVSPTKVNRELFEKADLNLLLGKRLTDIWLAADARIFNLEIPVSDNETPIKKTGANFIASEACMNGIKALKPSLVTLANNHIMDQGESGLRDTMSKLAENGIPFIGAGADLEESCKPYIIKNGEKKIGIFNCAEHEFSIAGTDSCGANPFDAYESLGHIFSLKEICDYVIVLYHGGKEYYRYPSPELQKRCRKMVDCGADLIVCQHSHCVGSYEEYQDSTIVYGQGNFIFNYHDDVHFETSVLINLDLDDYSIDYLPIVQSETGCRLAKTCEHEVILREFNERSSEIKAPGFIEDNYREFATEKYLSYLYTFAGYGRLMKIIDKYVFRHQLIKRKYNEKTLLRLLNIIRCESHNELVIASIEEDLKSK